MRRQLPFLALFCGTMAACGTRTGLDVLGAGHAPHVGGGATVGAGGAPVTCGAGGAGGNVGSTGGGRGGAGGGSGTGGGPGGAGGGAGAVRGCPVAGMTTLAANEPAPTSVAVDATHVYWATAGDCVGQVRSMAKGGGPIATLADQESNPAAIVVDEHDVYWTTGCDLHVRRVPLSGGAVADYGVVAAGGGDGHALALDSKNLYFQDYGVVGVPIAGGPMFTIDGKDFVYGLAADDGGVYWVGPVGGTEPMAVFAYPSGATAPTMLATVDAENAIALDPGWIYFVALDAKTTIARIPRTGGSIETVVANTYASAMATDGVSLYWADGIPGYNPANIHRTPVGGGADTVIAQATGWVGSMALDADCLYFTDPYGNAIRAVAR